MFKNSSEQLAFDGFDDFSSDNINKSIADIKESDNVNKTKVVFAKYDREEYMDPTELFNGFDTLEVITYSYGLSFIEEISDKFKDMTVVIGNEKIANSNDSMFELIVASQMTAIPSIRKHKKLVQRVIDKTATFCRVNDMISHQKIYLLSSEDDSCRVILGSANFSAVAWKRGNFIQEEDFIVFDDDIQAFLSFQHIFDEIKTLYVKPIEEEKITAVIKDVKEELDELPFVDEIISCDKTALILNEAPTSEEKQTIYLISEEIENLKGLQQKTKKNLTRTDSKGRIVVSSKNVITFFKEAKGLRRKDYVEEVPKFKINYKSETATFNDEPFDLSSGNEDNLKNDINVLLKYFDGYDTFIGTDEHKLQAKKAYYKMLNYIFLSPFVGKLRTKLNDTGWGQNYLPMFAIIRGKKSAGKSQFMETARAFMFPHTSFSNLTNKDFTQTMVGKYIANVEGVPIHIEDLSEGRFSKNKENIIKSETDILNNRLENYSSYIITTNEIRSLSDDIKKRMYYSHIPITQEDTNSTRKKIIVSSLLKQITGQLYISYLQKMIPKVNELMSEMETIIPDSEDYNIPKWEPDVFKISSETLIELFKEVNVNIPSYISVVTYEDYFGWENIKDEMTEWFREQCLYDSKAFKADRQRDTLEYMAEPAPERNYNKEKPVDVFYNRLPDKVKIGEPIGDKVIMNLSLFEEYFNVRFKNNRFNKNSCKIELLDIS